VRSAALCALVIAIVVFVAFVRLVGFADLGPGPWLALAGAASSTAVRR